MIVPSEKLLKSIDLASHLHRDQNRHDAVNTPYISHLFGVAILLASQTDDEDIVIAGIMHDSLEDVPEYTYDDLARDCGERVADIVRGVTENKSLPYKERKLAYIDHLRTGMIESLMVSVADKLHNARSLHTMPVEKQHNGHMILYNEVLKIARERTLSYVDVERHSDIENPLITSLANIIKNIETQQSIVD